MLTRKIINAAEKAMPVEQQFRDSVYDFYAPRKNRLIMGFMLGVFFTLTSIVLCYCTLASYIGEFVLCAISAALAMSFCGMFFGNIKRPSFLRYSISAAILALLMHASFTAYVLDNWTPVEVWQQPEELSRAIRSLAIDYAWLFGTALVLAITAGLLFRRWFRKVSAERS